jgi:hypothetical protein
MHNNPEKPEKPEKLTIRVAGRAAPTDMAAGQYLARGLDAEIKRARVVLTVRCEAGKYDGVLLTGWFPVYKNLSANHKLGRAFRIAVDRELDVDEEISLQEFVGKLFVIDATFRAGRYVGKKWIAEDPMKPKDQEDYLRVRDIVSLAESTTATSNTSYEQGTRSRARRVAKFSPRGVEEDE